MLFWNAMNLIQIAARISGANAPRGSFWGEDGHEKAQKAQKGPGAPVLRFVSLVYFCGPFRFETGGSPLRMKAVKAGQGESRLAGPAFPPPVPAFRKRRGSGALQERKRTARKPVKTAMKLTEEIRPNPTKSGLRTEGLFHLKAGLHARDAGRVDQRRSK